MESSPKSRMTAEDFIAWSIDQPSKGKRFELANGEVVAMASERARHALVKSRVCRRLDEAVEAAGLPCIVFPDGMAIRIDAYTVYEPDAALRCGEELPDETVIYDDPIVVVEVLSPSTTGVDTGGKFEDYFRLPSLHHYLIIRPRPASVVHHERQADGTIQTRILASGELRLDPPGITVDVASLFP